MDAADPWPARFYALGATPLFVPVDNVATMTTDVASDAPEATTAPTPARVLVFDTETGSLQGDIVQLAYNVYDTTSRRLDTFNRYLKLPPGRTVSPGSFQIHRIDDATLKAHGVEALPVLREFARLCQDIFDEGGHVVAHNAAFDCRALRFTWGLHAGDETGLHSLPTIEQVTCTMQAGFGKVPSYNKLGQRKKPKNSECYEYFFGVAPEQCPTLRDAGSGSLHDAAFDISVTARNYFEMRRRGWIR